MTLTLTCGASRLTLDPRLGGAILAFEHEGRPILRPTPAGAGDVLQTASFPIVPYVNRIAGGRFRFGGREVTLPPNLPGQRHPLHGQGWREPWKVESSEEAAAVMTLEHAPDEWPWRWRARQAFALEDGRLRATLAVQNLADDPMPAGLGFHPYFPAPPGTRLKAAVESVWLTDAELIPTREAPAPAAGRDWTAGDRVDGTPIDHCYGGWDGRAEISTPGRPATVMTGSPNCRWFQVYCPPGENFFVCEPVTHRPDPFAAPDLAGTGVTVLAPGEAMEIAMEIAVGH